MAFMWRRYSPTTNRSSLVRILSSHVPLEGKLMGIDGAERGRRDRTLTKRTMSGRVGWSEEMILRHQPDNLAPLADHDLRIKGKPGYQFGAELRSGDRLSDHEGSRRPDVDRIEMFQLFGERGRSEGPVTTDVDPSQKNHEGHEFPPAAGFVRSCSTRSAENRSARFLSARRPIGEGANSWLVAHCAPTFPSDSMCAAIIVAIGFRREVALAPGLLPISGFEPPNDAGVLITEIPDTLLTNRILSWILMATRPMLSRRIARGSPSRANWKSYCPRRIHRSEGAEVRR